MSAETKQEEVLGDEFYDMLLSAIDEAKPPSIWKERLFFMLVGLLGGMGLGVLIIVLR